MCFSKLESLQTWVSVWINNLEYDSNCLKLSQVQAASRNWAPVLSFIGVPSGSQIWEFSQLDLVLHFQLHWFAGLTWLSPHGSFWDEEIPGAFTRNGTCLSSSTNLLWIMVFLKGGGKIRRWKNPHLNSLSQLMFHRGMNWRNYKLLSTGIYLRCCCYAAMPCISNSILFSLKLFSLKHMGFRHGGVARRWVKGQINESYPMN